jgi:hypothetical protein
MVDDVRVAISNSPDGLWSLLHNTDRVPAVLLLLLLM